jgi:GrpB-like predicted nucleotidyltransferase (UPF0157 family)
MATMKILRFDAEVSVPITDFGSRFRIGPLTGGDSRVRVAIMHLPPEGLIGRHPAASQQLMAVVAGSGWVSGPDADIRQPVRAGYAALWAAGESHESGTKDGLTAVCIEGTFAMLATAVTQDIVVADYDPAWPEWFEQVRAHVWPAIADVARRIDHVGSTSVPDMAAKPIIDMDIVVTSEAEVRPVIERLAGIGYRWRGDLGVTGRQAFDPPPEPHLPHHHLYLVVENSKAHLDHWLLRDLLRADAETRHRYGQLKRANVERAGGNMEVYVAAKAALVAELLTRARAERGLPPATYWRPEPDG